MNNLWYAHIDMDAFFASIEIASRPYLKNRPVAVGGSVNERTVVSAASYEARKYGIKAGMPCFEAFRRCPNLIMIKPDMEKYESISKEIFEMIKNEAGNIEIYSVDECFFHAFSKEDIFDISINIRKIIKKNFKITCSVGIAENRLIAKLAGDEYKPDGIKLVENAEEYVKNKRVEKICGIGKKTKELLNSLGIYFIKDIKEFPFYVLKKHFKSYAYFLKDLAEGRDNNVLWNKNADIKSIGNSHTMSRDTKSLIEIKSMLMVLSQHVSLRMKSNGFTGNTVSLIVRYYDFETFSREKKINRFIDESYDIYNYSLHIFKNIVLEKKVRLLGITVSGLKKKDIQLMIPFNDEKEEKIKNVNKHVHLIKELFGEYSIIKASSLIINGKAIDLNYSKDIIKNRKMEV